MYCCKEARAGCSRGGRGPSRLPHEPNFDLAWQAGDTAFVVEIKSITDDNEEEQLRIGLGQVLRYRHCFQCIGYPKVIAVLVPSGPLATPPGQMVPRAFRTVHPLGWTIWKGEVFVPTEEELLTGIQG